MVKKQVVICAVLFLMIIIGISFSYSKAYFRKSIEVADTTLKVGTLEYVMTMNEATNNKVSVDAHKYLFLDVVITSKNSIDSKFSFVYKITSNNIEESDYEIGYIEKQDVPYGIIKANETKRIRIRIDNNSTNTMTLLFHVKSSLVNNEFEVLTEEKEIKEIYYQEEILNDCDPVLSKNLVPVVIEDDGTVKKADVNQEWYKYEEQKWANAVVLENKTNYSNGQVIPEENIQSYFVWIPRYKYKLFDMGNYSSLTEISNTAVQTIEVEFESKEVTPSVGTKVGDYHSHPSFQAFDTNGFWVGKFESGYRGATTTTGAEQNNNNSLDLIIKPNVYSWRSITLGNAFKVNYDYLREDESHMMKNTEWGAVAYLQHSVYGSRTSVRTNNNSSLLTGYASVTEPTCGVTTDNVSIDCNLNGTDSSVTSPYNTEVGYTASTTGNISGVYDMSGGAWEYVMGYNTEVSAVGGSSGITDIYEDFFTNAKWNKYYDQYYNNTNSLVTYNKRILGDATVEMGPFQSVKNSSGSSWYRSSWYGDFSYFVALSGAWFERSGSWITGIGSGIFCFTRYTGEIDSTSTFRLVLTL